MTLLLYWQPLRLSIGNIYSTFYPFCYLKVNAACTRAYLTSFNVAYN